MESTGQQEEAGNLQPKDGHEVMKVEDVELIFQLDVVIRRCTRCTRGVPPSPAKSTDQGPSLMMGVEP